MVTLLGDSCQAVSLLAGQGASLAMAGAWLLGEQLAADEPSGLDRYAGKALVGQSAMALEDLGPPVIQPDG